MKIAVYDSLPPGGARRSTERLLARLAPRHEVHLYSFNEPSDYCDLSKVAASVKRYQFSRTPPFRFPMSRLYFIWQMRDHQRLRETLRAMAAEMDGAAYDVCYLPSCRFTEVPLLPLFLKTPSVYHAASLDRNIHPIDERDYQKPRSGGLRRVFPDVGYARYLKKLRRDQEAAIHAATSVLSISYFLREHLYREYGVNARVVTRAVDASTFQNRNGVVRQNRVLSVGSLEPRKAHDFVIRSLGRIDAESRPRLGIVSNAGIPQERQHLETLARKEGVTLEWHENVSSASDMAALYSESLAVVCASVMEALGRVPLEAAACETPVIAVAEGGLRETVRDGVTGYLIQRSEEECADALLRCLKDEEAAKQIGRQGREEVLAHWNWDQIAESLERELLSVSGRKTEGSVRG